MSIQLDDPQIETIFINEFKSDIDAFTEFIKDSLRKRENKIKHLDPFKNSYKATCNIKYVDEKDNPFKDIIDSIQYAKELREKAWR